MAVDVIVKVQGTAAVAAPQVPGCAMDVFSHASVGMFCGTNLTFCPVKKPCGFAVVPLKMLFVTDQFVIVGMRLETLTPSRSCNCTVV